MVITSSSEREVVDITRQVEGGVDIKNGICVVTILHTTAAITTADMDPGTDLDFLDFLNSLIPEISWRHPHDPGHAPAHLLSSIIGSSVSIPVVEGQLQLGTWQRIVLVELDGPKDRNVNVVSIGKKVE